MTSRFRWFTPVVLVIATATLYLARLSTAPIYLAPDEVVVGVNAHTIATTGRDRFHGRLLPLYVEFDRLLVGHDGQRGVRVSWLPPGIFYAAALVLKVLPLSESAIRLPIAIAGIIDVLLLYFIGRRLFQSETLAVLCALLLALTPAHLIHSRMAADYLLPLPFMLGWLACMLKYLDEPRGSRVFAATLCLGIGLYSYAGATLMMPIYLLMTVVVLMMVRASARAYLLGAAGFLLPALLFVPWFILHPTMIAAVLTKYDLNVAGNMTALQSARSLFTVHRIADQLALYWGFFNPRLLFFEGPMEPMFSTRQVGVFLLPIAALLGAGIWTTIRAGVSPAMVLLWLGFLTAPLAATIVDVGDAIYRALELLPFTVLLAVYGIRGLWLGRAHAPGRRVLMAVGVTALVIGVVYAARVIFTQSRIPGAAFPLLALGLLTIAAAFLVDRYRLGQLVVIGLIAMVPLQFAMFYRDYLTDYRSRTSIAFSGNIRGAYEEVLRQERQVRPPKIYLGEIGSYSYGGLYWEFYLTKYGRLDLLDRTIDGYLFYADQVLQLPSHSLIVTNAGDGLTDIKIGELIAAGQLRKTAVITEPDGTPTYQILERLAPGG
jgi:4-amino-4-deoxy-L-arabinose transferase-like glycosyltransferase